MQLCEKCSCERNAVAGENAVVGEMQLWEKCSCGRNAVVREMQL